MSYLRYLGLFGYSGVQHILCCVFFVFCFVLFFVCLFVFVLCIVVSNTYCVLVFYCFCLRLVSCVPNFIRFSGLSIIDCPFDLSNVYLSNTYITDMSNTCIPDVFLICIPYSKYMCTQNLPYVL